MKKIIFVINNPDFLISHRLEICLKALDSGYDVNIICPYKPSISKLRNFGFTIHLLEFSREKKNPFSELNTIFQLVRLFTNIKPDLVHLITIKPYLYGGIAAKLARVPAVVSAVAGLGILFSSNALKYRLLRFGLYPIFKIAFSHKNQLVIFQNLSDKFALVNRNIVLNEQVIIIPGSGVNLISYPFITEPSGIPIITFAARLLKDKGVEIFVEASKILKQRKIEAYFWLIGEPDIGNANSIKRSQLKVWQEEGLVELYGFRDDIPQLFSRSNIVTLPSFYGEGLPKVLIEAAACGRAVITTDHPGCRDAIIPDVTGILIPTRDANSLADAIQYMIESSEARNAMGKAGRELAENIFDVNKVVEQHINIYEKLSTKN